MNIMDKDDLNYADLLYRRGGSCERIGKYEKSDKDLLDPLKIIPNNSYVLNYLAYSWLERNQNINKAILMLEKAYKENENDPYIIDSVGWGYFLVGKYMTANKKIPVSIHGTALKTSAVQGACLPHINSE